jgi:hypothetical protein
VNKPAGLDSVPWTQSHKKKRFTFQDYLPMVVPPPDEGRVVMKCYEHPQQPTTTRDKYEDVYLPVLSGEWLRCSMF